jgi:hypothetical protein
MAYLSPKDCACVFFDGLDVKQSNNELTITSEAICPRRRPIGSAYKAAFITGQKDSELTIAGWLDDVTSPQLGDLSVLFGGNAVSALFAGFSAAHVVGQSLGTSEDDLDTFTPTIVANGCIAGIGYVVAPYAAYTAAGNTDAAYATMTEASAASGRAYLHVAALTLGGSTSCTVKVRHSSDHITFADHTAFTNVTAIGAETIALAATVNKHLSISHAWNGAGAGQSISAFVGVVPD